MLLKAGAPPDQEADGRTPIAMTQNPNTKKLLKFRLEKQLKDEA